MSTAMIEAVIFDFGGVLVRTEDHGGRRKWEQRLGLPEGGLSAVVFNGEASQRASVGEIVESAVWLAVAQQFSLRDGELADLQRDFWSGDRLDTELVDYLRRLRPRYRTAILSNAWSNARPAFTRQFGLGDAVDALIISAEVGVMKPDARIYLLAAQALGVQPEAAVFVDDFVQNVGGARAVGMHAIQFRSREQVIGELEKLLDQ